MSTLCSVLLLVAATLSAVWAENSAPTLVEDPQVLHAPRNNLSAPQDIGEAGADPETVEPAHAKAKTRIAIVLDVIEGGKKVGSTKIPAGREVSVIEGRGTQCKVAIGALISGWTERGALQREAPSPAPNASKKSEANAGTAKSKDPLSPAAQADVSSLPVDVSKTLNLIRVMFNMPGMSALVVKNGRIAAQGASGYRRLGDPTPLLVNDPINIGSCTKWMTAVLAGRLVDRGIVKWTNRVRDSFKNFKDFDVAFHDATLEQFLAHRTGLQESDTFWKNHGGAIMGYNGTKQKIRTWVSETVMRDIPEVAPGKFHYSNQGYAVAANMMERATGKDWETLIREEIFAPARMATGRFGPVYDDELPPKAPVGHDLLAGKSIPEPRPLKETNFELRIAAAQGPGGSVACTLQDWAKFLHMMAMIDQLNFVSSATAIKLRVPFTDKDTYGLGVRVYDRSWAAPGPALHHGGSTAGLDTIFWVAPAQKLVIVVFTNCYARDGSSEVALDKAAALLISRFGQATPSGPPLEFPLVLSLGEPNRPHNVSLARPQIWW